MEETRGTRVSRRIKGQGCFFVDQKSNSRKQKNQKGGRGYNKNRSWGSSPLVDIAFNFLTSHPATALWAY
jgi:hypothetical protein